MELGPPPEMPDAPPFEAIPLSAYADAPPEPVEGPPPGADGWSDAAPAAFEQHAPSVSDRDPAEVLLEVFGYDSFRPLQRQIIDSVLQLKDTLAIMPTGGGKSLCYQLPALMFDGLTVVVSPLISLMQDQVRQLRALGIDAAVLNSSLSREDYRAQQVAVRSGRAKLLYVAPETLFQDRTMGLLKGVPVSCLTIDEAHCISEWGHDFRPEYRRMVEIRQQFPKAVCIGLTATATPRVRDDIAHSLGFSDDSRFVASFDRPNLRLKVRDKDNARAQLLDFVRQHDGSSGIVYCSTRKTVEEVAEKLAAQGLRVLPYHAGLPEAVRRENQERFIRDDVDIIVATVAFGMGINKPDVRFVAHYNLPKSIEGYYQEIGRAGRDGELAHCLLLYGGQDLRTIEFFIGQKPDTEQRIARLQLNQMLALAEATVCRRRPLLEYFGEPFTAENCGACDNCIDPRPDLVDITVQAQKYLSCIYRTGQMFGGSHIVDVLRGSKSQKVLQKGHDQLSTYGIGTDLDAKQWRHIGRQLQQHGLVIQDPKFGGLSLGPAAIAVLKGEQTIQGRIARPSRSKASRSERRAEAETVSTPELFQHLRQLRKQLADEQGIPPYVVFSDRTLRELTEKRPGNAAAMGECHGVGRVKLERYASDFLGAIREWCEENGEPAPEGSDRPDVVPLPEETTGKVTAERQSRLVAGLLLGRTLVEVADQENIKVGTAVGHVERFVRAGGDLSVQASQLTRLEPSERDAVYAAIDTHGANRLKPLFEALDGRFSYDDLRQVRLLWLLEQPPG